MKLNQRSQSNDQGEIINNLTIYNKTLQEANENLENQMKLLSMESSESSESFNKILKEKQKLEIQVQELMSDKSGFIFIYIYNEF